MRIGFFVPRCSTTNSHGRYVIELARRFAVDADVTVYSGAIDRSLNDIVECRHVPIPDRPAIARLVALWAVSRSSLRNRRFDVVHTQGADAPVGTVVTAQCCNAEMQTMVHGRTLSRRLNSAIGAHAERFCMAASRTRVVIAISKKVKLEIERHYGVDPAKVVVIYHGVDLDRFSPALVPKWRAGMRAQLGLNDADFAVLFVGGDYRGKGLLQLFNALDRLPARVKIIAAGIVPDALLTRTMAENDRASRITIVSPTSGIERYYAAADAFALPSFYDAFSMVTLEGMAAGLPVVASSESGIAELLTDGVDGLIVPPGDVDRLSVALARLEADEGLCREMAARGRMTAEKHSWDRVAAETRAAYAQAVSYPA